MRALVLLVFLVAGCYGPRLQPWVGSPAAELVERWGAPDSALGLDEGTAVLTWKHRWRDGFGRYTCRQSFTVRAGVVAGWSYEDCAVSFLLWSVPGADSSR